MVYVALYGNLGNLLFQYAAALTLGRGDVIGVTDSPKTISQIRESYASFFPNLELVAKPPASALVVRQFRFDPVEMPDPSGRDVFLEGFFQSENYFDRSLIYERYKPSEARVARLREKYGEWLSRPGVTGISVRRGDYLRLAAWHPFVGERYFRDCLRRLPEVRDFIVCSDGLSWCRKFFPEAFTGRNFLFIENESVLDQLAIHTLCANNIISNSSYSWWGAWLAGQRRRAEGATGRTLAPSQWLGYVPRRRGVKWDDIYFDGTEVVPNRYSFRLWLAAHWPIFAEKV